MKTIKQIFRILLFTLIALILLIFVLPFFIPIKPLENTVSPEELADVESRFVSIDGLTIHYKQFGQDGNDLILLHGFGAWVFSWHRVTKDLTAFGTVTAYDRPAFGLTERLMPEEYNGFNPYTRDYQPELLAAFMEELEIQTAVLIGNSAGGTVAAQMALRHPEKVDALILVDPALLTLGGPPAFYNTFFRLPSIDRIGPLFARFAADRAGGLLSRAFHDPSKITPEMIAGYRQPLRVENWDRAFWEFIKATKKIDLPSRLDEISVPVLIITGAEDQIIPAEESIRAAEIIPDAELVVIPDCGHAPQEECPEAFMDAVESFLFELEGSE